MAENKSLLGSGAGMVTRNKRYIVWFYLLNLLLGLFGTVSFVTQARTVLDHSLYADRLLHGFDLAVFGEMFARPEFGPTVSSGLSACCKDMRRHTGWRARAPLPPASSTDTRWKPGCHGMNFSVPAAATCGASSGC